MDQLKDTITELGLLHERLCEIYTTLSNLGEAHEDSWARYEGWLKTIIKSKETIISLFRLYNADNLILQAEAPGEGEQKDDEVPSK